MGEDFHIGFPVWTLCGTRQRGITLLEHPKFGEMFVIFSDEDLAESFIASEIPDGSARPLLVSENPTLLKYLRGAQQNGCKRVAIDISVSPVRTMRDFEIAYVIGTLL